MATAFPAVGVDNATTAAWSAAPAIPPPGLSFERTTMLGQLSLEPPDKTLPFKSACRRRTSRRSTSRCWRATCAGCWSGTRHWKTTKPTMSYWGGCGGSCERRMLMKVRDRTMPVGEYKGRWTEASDSSCPCRPCYNAHDWKTPIPVYKNGVHVSNNYPPDMRCATRENGGCPQPKPKPEHIYRSSNSAKWGKCKRCGTWEMRKL